MCCNEIPLRAIQCKPMDCHCVQVHRYTFLDNLEVSKVIKGSDLIHLALLIDVVLTTSFQEHEHLKQLKKRHAELVNASKHVRPSAGNSVHSKML